MQELQVAITYKPSKRVDKSNLELQTTKNDHELDQAGLNFEKRQRNLAMQREVWKAWNAQPTKMHGVPRHETHDNDQNAQNSI